MSELSSLYLRVRLSKQAYERFLASETADARDFSDWMDWLAKAKMYGELTSEQVTEIGRRNRKCSVADMLQAWTTNPWPSPVKSVYDEATETWRLAMPFFSENYEEFIAMLPPLRAVDRFKDRPGTDFMLVYDHFWSWRDDYVVLFEFSEGASVIAASPGQGIPFPKLHAEEASAFMQTVAPDIAADS
jgi:hypothetical protein